MPTGMDATATGSTACPQVRAWPPTLTLASPKGRSRAKDDLLPLSLQHKPSASGRLPGMTPSCPLSTGPPARGGGPRCGKTDPSGARNMVRLASQGPREGGKLPGSRKLEPGGDLGPVPQWSTGTNTGCSRWGRCPTTYPTCRQCSVHATQPRTTGTGTWSPTAHPLASSPPPSTCPLSEKRPSLCGDPVPLLRCLSTSGDWGTGRPGKGSY